jgi:hypothetical protein
MPMPRSFRGMSFLGGEWAIDSGARPIATRGGAGKIVSVIEEK